jgi:hypothetical protein
MLAEGGHALDSDLVLEDGLFAAMDVDLAEEALAAHALSGELVGTPVGAADAGIVADLDLSLVNKVPVEVVPLGDALLAPADLLTTFADDAMAVTKGAAAVDARADRGIAAGTEKRLDAAGLSSCNAHAN